MSADFSKQSIFDEKKGYKQVKFAKGVPVTEVELDEVQEIQNYKRNVVLKQIISDGFINKYTMTLISGVLTIPADTVIVGGEAIEILDAMIYSNLVEGNVVYLDTYDAFVDYDDTIHQSGNLSGGTVLTNTMLDNRVGEETTRRLQKQVNIITSATLPSLTGHIYLPIVTIGTGNTFTDNRVVSRLSDARIFPSVKVVKSTDVPTPDMGVSVNLWVKI